jgi:stress response protein YsnF
MQHQTIVGLYPTRTLAEDVQSRLQVQGIPNSDISLGADRGGAASREPARQPKQEEGFWAWLFGSEVSADDRERYSGRLRSGHVAVSVRVRSDAEKETVIALMEQFDPVDIEGDEENLVPTTGVAGDATGEPQALTRSAASAGGSDPATAAMHRSATDGDQVIPIAKEELEVGKRQVERRYRIRTHVIETPVEEQVHLRDERVVIERRPATGTATAGTEGLQEREFDVVERHEEPVVGKRARATEEVVVRKEANERVETVRDTVRETKVDVDKAVAADKPSAAQTPAENSKI